MTLLLRLYLILLLNRLLNYIAIVIRYTNARISKPNNWKTLKITFHLNLTIVAARSFFLNINVVLYIESSCNKLFYHVNEFESFLNLN